MTVSMSGGPGELLLVLRPDPRVRLQAPRHGRAGRRRARPRPRPGLHGAGAAAGRGGGGGGGRQQRGRGQKDRASGPAAVGEQYPMTHTRG